MLRFLLMLPEKDDEGRQVFIVRPGDYFKDNTSNNYYYLQRLTRHVSVVRMTNRRHTTAYSHRPLKRKN